MMILSLIGFLVIMEALNQAYEAANDIQKQRISYVRDTVTEWVNRYGS